MAQACLASAKSWVTTSYHQPLHIHTYVHTHIQMYYKYVNRDERDETEQK
jgi:hypothetical protein